MYVQFGFETNTTITENQPFFISVEIHEIQFNNMQFEFLQIIQIILLGMHHLRDSLAQENSTELWNIFILESP